MEVVVGLDLHLKKTQGVVMEKDGTIVKQLRFATQRKELAAFLDGLPAGTQVALESLGFCWPWIDAVEELGYKPLLANPRKVKQRAEDVKTDKVDAEVIAHLTRMGWLPTCYVPPKELRMLRSFLRHRAALRRYTTAFKNRAKSELRKRDTCIDINLSTICGRVCAKRLDILELQQDVEIIDHLEILRKKDERLLASSEHAKQKPVQQMLAIPGIGTIIALTVYAEVCDIRRFQNADKLAHYCGLAPKVYQSGDKAAWTGREATQVNKWLKHVLIEASWSHIRCCPNGRLAHIYKIAFHRKKSKTKAIKIVARRLVNIIWSMWMNGTEFHAEGIGQGAKLKPLTVHAASDRFSETEAHTSFALKSQSHGAA